MAPCNSTTPSLALPLPWARHHQLPPLAAFAPPSQATTEAISLPPLPPNPSSSGVAALVSLQPQKRP